MSGWRVLGIVGVLGATAVLYAATWATEARDAVCIGAVAMALYAVSMALVAGAAG